MKTRKETTRVVLQIGTNVIATPELPTDTAEMVGDSVENLIACLWVTGDGRYVVEPAMGDFTVERLNEKFNVMFA